MKFLSRKYLYSRWCEHDLNSLQWSWLDVLYYLTDNFFFCPDHDIVARFNLKKPFSFLEDNILLLEEDIFNEIDFPSIKVLALSYIFFITYFIFRYFDFFFFWNQVVILSLEPIAGSNATTVVFGVDPDANYSKISQTVQSLIKGNFVSMVLQQPSLHLTTSLFGEPFLFGVLKFPDGITISPPQHAFLLQKVKIFFNFTLNFSIYQIQLNFDELTSQLKSGLNLTPNEVWQSSFFVECFHYAYLCLRKIVI